MTKCFLILIVAVSCFSHNTNSAPAPPRFIPVIINNPYGLQNRGIFDIVGNWIQSSDWFPIEINVPDTITGIGQGITNLGSQLGNFAQGLPFINRITSQFTPRPYKYLVLMPAGNNNGQMPGGGVNFNPFENVASFPTYP